MTRGGLKTRFVLDLVAAGLRGASSASLARLRARLSGEALALLERVHGPSAAESDVTSFDDAEELLLTLDAQLCAGSGQLLERVLEEAIVPHVTRSQGLLRATAQPAGLFQLRALIERPWIDARPQIELDTSSGRYRWLLSIPGRARSTRLFALQCSAALRALHHFSAGADEGPLRITLEYFGDRARLEPHHGAVRSTMPPAPEAPVSIRSRSASLRRVSRPSLSAEVEEILGSTVPETRRPSQLPPAGGSKSAANPLERRPSSQSSLAVTRAPSGPLPGLRSASTPPPRRRDDE